MDGEGGKRDELAASSNHRYASAPLCSGTNNSKAHTETAKRHCDERRENRCCSTERAGARVIKTASSPPFTTLINRRLFGSCASTREVPEDLNKKRRVGHWLHTKSAQQRNGEINNNR